jgi:hypothetical protein
MNRLLILGCAVAVATMGCLVPTTDGDAGVDGGLTADHDAGPPTTLAGSWSLVGTYTITGTSIGSIRSFHTAVGTETDGGVTFDIGGWCQLKAVRSGTQVTLEPNQHCTVPTNTTFPIAVQATDGGFGAQMTLNEPYCYRIELASAGPAPYSTTSLRFTGTGAAGSGGVDNATCDTTTTQALAVQLDLTR